MVDFIEKHRDEHGVEPICRVLPIAPSTYYEHRSRRTDPESRSARAKRDEELEVDIKRVWQESYGGVYGARKVWEELLREGVEDLHFYTLNQSLPTIKLWRNLGL